VGAVQSQAKGIVMASNKELLKVLNSLLQYEYKAMMQYLQNSYLVRGQRREAVKAWLQKMAQEEMMHASKIADKVVSLGGTPSLEIPPVRVASSVKDIIHLALDTERGAVAAYTKALPLIERSGDLHLRLLAEEMIADSQGEVEEIQKMLE
jgi:bacterioferritin